MAKIIGLSGVAGAGKDLFLAELQKQEPRFVRFAFADELKRELNPFLTQMYGVDIFTCSRELKNKVRPILVEHGRIRRIDSKGTHWSGFLKNQIREFQSKNPDALICVTDVRYDVYEKDEVSWLREEMGGILVHIQRYIQTDYMQITHPAPNADEAENDPKLIAKADYKVEWPTVTKPDGSVDLDVLKPYVTDFLKFYHNQN